MSIFGAMQSGISGLAAQSTAMGAISDNISNVNTIGYKGTSVSFQTLVTKQTSSNFYSPGGVQPVSKQGVDVQMYAKTELNSNQMFEILRGLHSKIDVSVYARPEFNSEQMAEIRLGLEIGLNVKDYAKPDIDARQMRMTRLRLWKRYM